MFKWIKWLFESPEEEKEIVSRETLEPKEPNPYELRRQGVIKHLFEKSLDELHRMIQFENDNQLKNKYEIYSRVMFELAYKYPELMSIGRVLESEYGRELLYNHFKEQNIKCSFKIDRWDYTKELRNVIMRLEW